MASSVNYDSSSSSDEVNADNACGYNFELVDEKNPEQFTCIVCHLIIRGFVEVRCGNGHAGCQFCIDEWEKQKYR